jgi:hypothetical protein
VCQQGGEIILCDTCPKAYHLVCLDPELESAPEGEWFCPTCEKDGVPEQKRHQAAAQAESEREIDVHNEFCTVCRDGGELLCCEKCPQSYHTFCLNPMLKTVPEDEWLCPKCACEPLKAPVKKILTWRWRPDEEPEPAENDEKSEKSEEKSGDDKAVKRKPPPVREYYIKYDGLSYWHCDWASEIQLEVYHKTLWRCYTNKMDMTTPPQPESLVNEPNNEEEDQLTQKYYDPALDARFYRNGIRPQWLRVHRVLNHKKTNKGQEWYLIKWRDLGYDQSTWELEGGEIADEIVDWKKQTDAI